MAMRISWYGAECITQYGRFKATLDAIGCHHCYSSRIAPVDAMVIDFGVKK